MAAGCLPLILILWLLLLIPIFFADAMMTAMVKLGIHPALAVHLVVWIFLGSLVNIPVKRLERTGPIQWPPPFVFGLNRFFYQEMPTHTTVAVNLGGCVIPGVIALYEFLLLAKLGGAAFLACLVSAGINIAVCHRFSRVIPHLGIAIPTFIPPLVAATAALILYPQAAPPVAFCAGVLGPLIGADLLHLKRIGNLSSAGIVSIGGAGTFDGIVLSGLIATLLA